MQLFVYQALDKKGRKVTGRINAPSMGDAQKQFKKRDLELISMRLKGQWYDRFLSLTVRMKDRAFLYRQLTTMLKAGLSITQAMEIASQTPNKYLKQVTGEIVMELENGYPLSVCMSNYPGIFPNIEVGVVKAGEATGKMEKVLDELALENARNAAFIAKVRGAMIYPATIFIVLIGVAVIVMWKIVPSFKEIFTENNLALPLTTQIVISASDFILNKWWLALLIVAVFVVAVMAFVRTKPGNRVWSILKINLPLVGSLPREIYLASFNRTLAMLLQAGVPIIQAVNIIGSLTTNSIYKEIVGKLSKSLEQGAPITSTLQASKYFPPMMVQLLYVGQQSGDLSGMCSTLADYYQEEVENRLKNLSSIIEPAVIVIIAFGVGFIVVSILQPIYFLASTF